METQSGELVKLKIESFSDQEYQNKDDGFFEVMFNPNQYTNKYEIQYDEQQASGTSANAPSFSNMKSQELTLELFLDGTGVATGKVEDVQSRVDEFLDRAYSYAGETHQNRYLRIIWSTLIFDCVLKSADITYTLFNSEGKPLRAKINAKLMGFVNDELREKKEGKTSPDLTHVYTVKGRERIDALSDRIYKTPAYYIDVAQANELSQFRKLGAGMQLIFPPVVKNQP
jgi:hypothetical protein